ncbi:hypothetical protein RB195_023372 [Necator americanus]|uniref:Profilin n=1 Tax=Necator americanus TaxID=51031 RepID=A0ABR1EIW2_NECAM
MEFLATTIRFVTLNYHMFSSELQQAALSKLPEYICVPFAVLQEARIRDRSIISVEDYTVYCGDADGKKLGGCAIAVRNDCNNLVEEYTSTSSVCAFVQLRVYRGHKLWVVSAQKPLKATTTTPMMKSVGLCLKYLKQASGRIM